MQRAVCLCCDRNMAVPALFVACAVAAKRDTTADYDVIVVTTGPDELSGEHRRWLGECGVQIMDRFDVDRFEGVEILQSRLSKATLVKLFLAELFDGVYDRILYLDSDLVICGPVAPIFALDMGGLPLAAAPAARIRSASSRRRWRKATAHFRALGMTEPFRYINTGVLLIDVGEWNRTSLGARALGFIRSNPALCRLPDEDALNAVLNGNQVELSPLWNMRAGIWAVHETRDGIDPVILHYDGPAKPWKRFARGIRLFQHRETYELYSAFLRSTPWSGWLDEQWNLRGLLENLYSHLLHDVARVVGKESPARRRAFAADFRRFCTETAFADLEQGIATLTDGRLRLSHHNATSPTTAAGADIGT